MKMGRAMISEVHLDDYAVETAYGRHKSMVIGHEVLVNSVLAWFSVCIAIPTTSSCQKEKHACEWPMHNDLDPYNIELSCPAESEAAKPSDRSTDSL
jgi:hypothetical protein